MQEGRKERRKEKGGRGKEEGERGWYV